MKFDLGKKKVKAGRKRIIFDSDSEEEALVHSDNDDGQNQNDGRQKDSDQGLHNLDWLKEYRIPRQTKRWSQEQIENLKKKFKGLDDLDDSILQNVSLRDLAVVSRQQMGGGEGFLKDDGRDV